MFYQKKNKMFAQLILLILMTDLIDPLWDFVVGQLPDSRWRCYYRVTARCPRTAHRVASRNRESNCWLWDSQSTAQLQLSYCRPYLANFFLLVRIKKLVHRARHSQHISESPGNGVLESFLHQVSSVMLWDFLFPFQHKYIQFQY